MDGGENSLWVEHGWFVAVIMQSRSIGAADSVASRISPAAAGFPAMAASIIHSAHSQESFLTRDRFEISRIRMDRSTRS